MQENLGLTEKQLELISEACKLKKGQSKIIKCPYCNEEKLSVGRSSYNGHFHVYCQNKCIIIIQ